MHHNSLKIHQASLGKGVTRKTNFILKIISYISVPAGIHHKPACKTLFVY